MKRDRSTEILVNEETPSTASSDTRTRESKKALCLKYFRMERVRGTLMGVCTLCVGVPHMFCMSKKAKEGAANAKEFEVQTFGNNYASAFLHLQSAHNVDQDNPTPTKATDLLHLPPTKQEVYDFIAILMQSGVGTNLLAKEGFRRMLRAHITPYLAVQLTVKASMEQFTVMRKILRSAANRPVHVSLVVDLGTVSRLQTINVLAVATELNRAWLVYCSPTATRPASLIDHPPSSADVLCFHIKKAIRFVDAIGTIESRPLLGNLLVIDSIISDNAMNLVNACRQLRKRYEKYRDILHFNCSCHVLNLIGRDVFDSLKGDYGLVATEKLLLERGMINRIVPTRWWCRTKEYETFLASVEDRARFMEDSTVKDSVKKIQSIVKYVERVRVLQRMCRVLEKNDATALVAITGLMRLMNHPDHIIRSATMNRYLKWYAPSEIPILFAFFSIPVLGGLGYLRTNSAFYKALLGHIIPILNPKSEKEITNKIASWFLMSKTKVASATDIAWKSHWSTVPIDFHVFEPIHRKLGCIAASESACERSFSCLRTIRLRRYRLSASRGSHELMLSVNTIANRSYLRQQTALGSQTTQSSQLYSPHLLDSTPDEDEFFFNPDGEETESDDERQRKESEKARNTAPAVEQVVPTQVSSDDHIFRSLTGGEVGTLNVALGQQVFMLWYWRTEKWETLKLNGLATFQINGQGEVFESVITDINRKSYWVAISYKKKNSRTQISVVMDLSLAFRVLLQMKSVDETRLTWPNREYSFDLSPTELAQFDVSTTVLPEEECDILVMRTGLKYHVPENLGEEDDEEKGFLADDDEPEANEVEAAIDIAEPAQNAFNAIADHEHEATENEETRKEKERELQELFDKQVARELVD